MSINQTFKVKGMHCASCASIIEKTLKKQAGVESASVNYGNESAKISFDEGSETLPRKQNAAENLFSAAFDEWFNLWGYSEASSFFFLALGFASLAGASEASALGAFSAFTVLVLAAFGSVVVSGSSTMTA